MSLQVCHCGWSKVTTYHGLRIHQGKMGCTVKGARVAQSEQQYMWANLGHSNIEKDLRLDVYASFKNNTADVHSEISLQICHCGWTKKTTYQGLRIHQGKMGCTSKGKKIPKKEQYEEKNRWDMEVYPTRVKEEPPSLKVCTSAEHTTAKIKKELSSPFASLQYGSQRLTALKARSQLQDVSQVNRLAREQSEITSARAVRVKHQASQRTDRGAMEENTCTDHVTVAAEVKEEPNSPPLTPQSSSQRTRKSKANHQLLEFYTDVQVNMLARKTSSPVTEVRQKDRKSQTMQKDASVSPPINSTAGAKIKEEPESPFPTSPQPFQRASTSGSQLQDFCTGVEVNGLTRQNPSTPPLAAAVQPEVSDEKDQTKSQGAPGSAGSRTKTIYAAAETVANQDAKSEETTEPHLSTSLKVKELTRMFSAITNHEAAGRQKEKHRQEPKPVSNPRKMTLQVPTFLATAAQESAGQPNKKDRNDQKASQVSDSSGATQMNPAEKHPKSSQLSDGSIGMKVKELVRMFSATTKQEARIQSKENHREEPKWSQVKQLSQRFSSATDQETVHTNEDPDLMQGRQDIISGDLKHKIQMREEKMAACRSSVNSYKTTVQPFSLDTVWPEINRVFSEVMTIVEDAKQKSLNLPLSSLRATTSTMMEQIHQKLDHLTSVEFKWASKFAVDVKLDPATAQRCLVSADGMKVSNTELDQKARDTPERFGSVLGLNGLTTGKCYWEVEVSRRTGWDLGVARGSANRKLSLNPHNGFWITAHYENKEYAALTSPPVELSLEEKPHKVGVFVDYEGGLVSFYNATSLSHIYSFTECSFTGQIFPYFSVHLRSDPLIISAVKHH